MIEEGTELADLTVDLTSLTLTHVPEGALVGARTLTVEGVTVELDGENAVTDPAALDVLSQVAALRAATEQEGVAVTGTWSLRDPLEVAVIPPHALAVQQSGACVVTSDEVRAVTVVGSELGQSFVTFDGEVPDQVDAHIGDVQCP